MSQTSVEDDDDDDVCNLFQGQLCMTNLANEPHAFYLRCKCHLSYAEVR
jgi:hypothetical protein